jgi:hypothetical protein
MEFVKPLGKKLPPTPHGWQRNTCEATGDAFYSHVASGRIVYKFDDMSKNRAVTPSQAPSAASAAVELFPDDALSGAALVNIYATPRSFRDGSASKPVMLEDDDDISDALSDLTNTQMTRKRPPKRQKRVFYPAESEGPVTGEEGFESGSENLEMSPNLLD